MFSHACRVALGGQCGSVSPSLWAWNILTSIGWIIAKCCADIYGQRMTLGLFLLSHKVDSCCPQRVPRGPLRKHRNDFIALWLIKSMFFLIQWNIWMDWNKIWYKQGPHMMYPNDSGDHETFLLVPLAGWHWLVVIQISPQLLHGSLWNLVQPFMFPSG